MTNLRFFTCILLPAMCMIILPGARLSAQTLPHLDIPLSSNNYFEICNQLDAYFAEEYVDDEADCWDDELVQYQRWKWWWRDRIMPDGSFPDLRDQWLTSRRQQAQHSLERNDQPMWKHEGPVHNPDFGYWGMGRTKNVAFHPTNPNIMWVGTPDGGIWKSNNAGETWETLGDGLPYLPVGVILVDKQNPQTLYISLGDKGGWWMWNLGVYKSTDGGISWAPTGLDWSLTDQNVIYNMIMSPANSQVIFVAANRGIYRTIDGGANWQLVRTGEYTDVKFKPGDPNTIYAAHHDYWGTSQLDKSTDGGETWAQISDFTLSQNEIRLSVTPVKPNWLGVHFSNGKRFLLSKDGGATFKDNAAPDDDWGIFLLSPTDSNAVFLCGTVVHRSLDQGKTWDAITHWYNDGIHAEVHADAHDLVYNPHNPDEIWYCNDGGIYRYEQFAETWVDFSDGLAIAQFYRIDVSQSGNLKIAAGSQDNGGWLRSTFGWKHTNGGDAMSQIIDPSDNNLMYTEYYGGNDIYRGYNDFDFSVNIADNIPGNPSGDWVTPFILNPQNPKTFLVGLHDIYRSFNQGDDFHKISENLTGSEDNKLRDIIMSPADTNIILACRVNRVYKTINGGQNWTSKTISSTEDITRLAVHPSDPLRYWATKGGYAAGKKVFTTVNGGAAWLNISGNLPNVPINCLVYDSITNYLLVGSDIGVFYSDADSINWKPYGLGMPAVYVLDLKIHGPSHHLYAGTHGRGVFSVDLETILSTNNNSAELPQVSAYPNPVAKQLFFKTLLNHPFKGEINLFDAMGRKVLQKNVAGQRIQDVVLDLAGLPQGVYFLRAVEQSGAIWLNQKIVKR